MRTTVKAARRYGSYYLVTLACGHQLTMDTYELGERQIYLGKAMRCEAPHVDGAAMTPRREGSPRCKSGSIASGGTHEYCACDTCF